ncbi:hypothetical protein PR048_027407 [Dryococelus australis]|uniref:Uncharacterized protein n=1 Tax=Dryococelus australis TaxID=614101 RepID=A0ABQ9GFD8_9NEOP|nr:hypothetical protein PR048_027407 [Dryococelus australis]
MRVIEVNMKQRRNERAGETGDPRKARPTNGIVSYYSHMRKSGVTRWGLNSDRFCGRRNIYLPRYAYSHKQLFHRKRVGPSHSYANQYLVTWLPRGRAANSKHFSVLSHQIRCSTHLQNLVQSIKMMATATSKESPRHAASVDLFTLRIGSRDYSPSSHPGAAPFSTRFTLVGSQDLVVEIRPNLSPRLNLHQFRNSPLNNYKVTAQTNLEMFSAFEAEKRWSNKGDIATRTKCAIDSMCKALNWRAVFSSHWVYLWHFQRRTYYFIGGKSVDWFSAETLSSFPVSERKFIQGRASRVRVTWFVCATAAFLVDYCYSAWRSFLSSQPGDPHYQGRELRGKHMQVAQGLVLRARSYRLFTVNGAGMRGRGKQEIPEKTRRPKTSSVNPVTRPGIEPGSPRWKESVLIAQPPWPHVSKSGWRKYDKRELPSATEIALTSRHAPCRTKVIPFYVVYACDAALIGEGVHQIREYRVDFNTISTQQQVVYWHWSLSACEGVFTIQPGHSEFGVISTAPTCETASYTPRHWPYANQSLVTRLSASGPSNRESSFTAHCSPNTVGGGLVDNTSPGEQAHNAVLCNMFTRELTHVDMSSSVMTTQALRVRMSAMIISQKTFSSSLESRWGLNEWRMEQHRNAKEEETGDT